MPLYRPLVSRKARSVLSRHISSLAQRKRALAEKTIEEALKIVISDPIGAAKLIYSAKLDGETRSDDPFIFNNMMSSVRKNVSDRLRSSLLNFVLKSGSQAPLYETMLLDIIDLPLKNSDKWESLQGILDTIAQIQAYRITHDIETFFREEYASYREVLKDEKEIQQRVLGSFLESADDFFASYRIRFHEGFYSALFSENLVPHSEYATLLTKLLNCNMSLLAPPKSAVSEQLNSFFLFLSSKSTLEDCLLVSGASWHHQLDQLRFPEDANLPIADINGAYLDSKLSLYSPYTTIKLIHRLSKEQRTLAPSVTSKIIALLSPVASDSENLQQLNSIAVTIDSTIHRLLAKSWKGIEGMNASKHLNQFTIKLLSKFMAALVPYTLQNMGPDAVLEIVARTEEINNNLQRSDFTKGLKLRTDQMLILVVRGLRQSGQIEKSQQLLSVLLDISVNKVKKSRLKQNALLYKDLLTEFLIIVKASNPNNPKPVLGYIIELMTNFKAVGGRTTAELFLFYQNNQQKNLGSAFYLLNELGLIRTVYENKPESLRIDYGKLDEVEYYKNNLERYPIQESLNKGKITDTALSIAYSSVFDYLRARECLTASALEQLFEHFIKTIEKVQKLSESLHPFSKANIDTVILIQFLNCFYSLGEHKLAEKCLTLFLQRVQYEKHNVSIRVFERLVYKLAVNLYKGKRTDRDEMRSKVINWISLMNSTFQYPLGFWSKFLLILLNESTDKELSKKYFESITEQGKSYDKIRHFLLISIAKENEWPLPEYLQNLNIKESDLNILDEDGSHTTKHFNFTADDIKEFENDRLEETYEPEESSNERLPVSGDKRQSSKFDLLVGKFKEMY